MQIYEGKSMGNLNFVTKLACFGEIEGGDNRKRATLFFSKPKTQRLAVRASGTSNMPQGSRSKLHKRYYFSYSTGGYIFDFVAYGG